MLEIFFMAVNCICIYFTVCMHKIIFVLKYMLYFVRAVGKAKDGLFFLIGWLERNINQFAVIMPLHF